MSNVLFPGADAESKKMKIAMSTPGWARVEDEPLLRGKGRYTDDLATPSAAFGVVLRSPHAAADILSIDKVEALRLPGVLAVYTAADAGIIQPVVIRQDLPPWRTGVRGNFAGLLDVLISETGDVQSAELRTPVHPLYNSVLVEAARRWQYKPAMKDGTPVRFLKTMIVNLGAN